MYNVITIITYIIIFSSIHYLYQSEWVNWIHSLLTNFTNNYLLLITLAIITNDFCKFKINYRLLWLFISTKYATIYIDLIALHNNLFIYHPFILYTTLIIIFLHKFRGKKIKNFILNLSWFSFILGGYWASQEFNWGGWWNWDSLEMGIFFSLVFVTILYHTNLSFLWNYVHLNCFMYVLVYWFFNKFGVTISIHSFVRNTFLEKYFIFIIILFCNLKVSIVLICTTIILLQIKYTILSIFFFKILFTIIYFSQKKMNFKNITFGKIHNFFYIITIFFINVNIFNLMFYKTSSISNVFIVYKLKRTLVQIACVVDYVLLNNLKKDFFFFKFFNYYNFTNGWFLKLNNFFSNNSWLLIIKMLKKYTKSFTKLHKKRIFNKSIITFNYINNINFLKKKKYIYVYFYKTFFIKFKFFRKLRKLLKKKLKKKYIQVYFFCKPNFLIHEKFKNARMGKGKGSPTVWVFQPHLTHPTFIFKNCNINRAYLLKYFLQIYFNPNLLIKLI